MKKLKKGMRESQLKKCRWTTIDNAVAEQLKSQAAAHGLNKGSKGSIVLPQQIVGSRRRTEDILVDMCERLNQMGNGCQKPGTGKDMRPAQPGKSNGRRRRRSPKIFTDNRA